MLPNRLAKFSEINTDAYTSFMKDFQSLVNSKNLNYLQGIRSWEYYALVEGIFTPSFRVPKILDTGSYFTVLPIYLRQFSNEVIALDNNEWLDSKHAPYPIQLPKWHEACSVMDVSPVKMDLINLSYPDNYFDIVVCSSTIEHVIDWRTALKELLRVGKRLLLSTDCNPEGCDYIHKGRFFSFDEIQEIASIMNTSKVDTSSYDIWTRNFTLAVIREGV